MSAAEYVRSVSGPTAAASKSLHFGRMSAKDYAKSLSEPPIAGPIANVGASPARKKRANPEEDLHILICEWIFLQEFVHPILRHTMHCPNGGRRSKAEAGRFKAMGVRKGVSDLINPFSTPAAKGFACELKAPGGKLTPEQEDFFDKAKSDGWVTGVCFSLDQFIALMGLYLGLPAK